MTDDERQMLLEAAQLDLVEARRSFQQAIRQCYPIGSTVKWKTGKDTFKGTVIGHPLDIALQVMPGYKQFPVRVTAYAVMEALKDRDDEEMEKCFAS